MGSYVPSTVAERDEMLKVVGVTSTRELFSHIPDSVPIYQPLNLPEGKSELEVLRLMEAISKKNVVFDTIFRGAGAYNHYIPAAVKRITSREEFLTAYTPYQAEISQGVLQSIFEYQTMICELTGMDSSNASVYDGASAAAEAVAMCKDRKRSKVLISAAAHPDVITTVQSYCWASGSEVQVVPAKGGRTDMDALRAMLDSGTACVYLQHPNFYGLLEDAEAIGAVAHEAGAKFIMGCNPIALAVLKTPRDCGADIAVGEGQPLGMPLSFGGPYLGFMACTSDMTRKLPGRISGETVDLDGKRAFVLTLQAREQHIRREKASSNICSNQALCAMTAAVFMGAMGPEGLRQMAVQSHSKAVYAAECMGKIPGFAVKTEGEFFHEFVTACPDVKKTLDTLQAKGILGGYPLEGEFEGCLLWCFTEMNTREEIDNLVAVLKEVAGA